MEDIYRIKMVLLEKKRAAYWLSEQMVVTLSTASKRCTDTSHPELASILRMADLIKVEIRNCLGGNTLSHILWFQVMSL